MTEQTETWRKALITTATGAPKPLLANAITALRDSPAWQCVLSFDTFLHETIMDGAPPWSTYLEWEPAKWSAHDDLLVTDWLHRQEIGVASSVAAQAVEVVSKDRSFHPVQEYLLNLQHDGEARAETWLTTYLGAEQSDYIANVGRAMLIGAVARIFDPGCKVDTVPILEGPQGARKSTAIKTMFAPWFTDELEDFGSKDAAMQTRGVWGIEVSELDAMNRGEVAKIKAFISRTTDRFRPPYGHRVIESPRACVFWGTTNSDSYLKDETGGRRFWPIKVGTIDIDGLSDVRDQLWAEAIVLYQANVPWWITRDDIREAAEDEQRSRYTGDPWEDALARYVETEREVSVEKALRDGLAVDIHRCGQIEQNRVARILRSLGWLRVQRRTGDKRRWVYVKPVTGEGWTGDESSPFDNVTTLRPVTRSTPVTSQDPEVEWYSPPSPQSPRF